MRHAGTKRLGAASLWIVLAWNSGPGAQESGKPADIGLVEKANVRMVVVDVVVLDREGRTVSGLGAADFEVSAEGKPVRVASVDAACPGGGAADPAGAYRAGDDERGEAPPGARKIVIVLDYQHLARMERTDVLDRAKRMIREGIGSGDEVMVAALTGGLRVEQPFDKDPERTLRTLQRMQYDLTLWNGSFPHLTEQGLLDGLAALFDVLGTVPGPKAVVLYSSMKGTPLDFQFGQIAALAAGSRCSIYPVDAGGLNAEISAVARAAAPTSMAGGGGGGASVVGTAPATGLVSLARLAEESGGRFTERSNDLALGFARAQRDLACVYSIGFYDESPEEDKVKRLAVHVLRPGLHVAHPTSYILRSASAKKESLLRAAYLSPEMFDKGVLRAHLFPLRPTGTDSWEALLAVSFPVPLVDTGGRATDREFGAVLQNGTTVVRHFSRSLRLEPNSKDSTSRPLVTFLERVSLAPGHYTVTAVMDDPAIGNPNAAKVAVELPAIPRGEIFLVGPILGRRAGGDLLVRSGSSSSSAVGSGDTIGDPSSFQPLLVLDVSEPTDLVALTTACFVGHPRKSRAGRVERVLRLTDGSVVGTFDPLLLSLEGEGKIHCQNLVDVLPVQATRRNGAYVFEASLQPFHDEALGRSDARFAVERAKEGGAGR